MTRLSNKAAALRSTGWCALLGGARDPAQSVAKGAANRAARLSAMGAVIDGMKSVSAVAVPDRSAL